MDAAVGERTVFKQRGKPPQRLGAQQTKPKRLAFLLDASASMSRGDALDGRLRRMGATAALLMEALAGFEHKFAYSMSAHSGSSAEVSLVEAGKPPLTVAERARVVSTLFSHAAGSATGDNSLEAARRAISDIAAVDADDRFVLLLSDANLGRRVKRCYETCSRREMQCCTVFADHSSRFLPLPPRPNRYDVSPEQLGAVLRGSDRVRAYCIFVAEPLAAQWLSEQLPFGRGFAVQDVAKLPNVIKEIFTHAASMDAD